MLTKYKKRPPKGGILWEYRMTAKAHIDTRAYNALVVDIRNAQILRLACFDAERALKALDGLQSDPEASEALRKAVLIITRQRREAERTVTAAFVALEKVKQAIK